jgi:hypothetical protein
MQENGLERLGGHVKGPRPLPRRLVELGVDRPRVALSEVLTFDLNGEAIHIVERKDKAKRNQAAMSPMVSFPYSFILKLS